MKKNIKYHHARFDQEDYYQNNQAITNFKKSPSRWFEPGLRAWQSTALSWKRLLSEWWSDNKFEKVAFSVTRSRVTSVATNYFILCAKVLTWGIDPNNQKLMKKKIFKLFKNRNKVSDEAECSHFYKHYLNKYTDMSHN